MSYLGIDVARAADLATALRQAGDRVGPIRRLVAEAETLAEVTAGIDGRLDEVETVFTTMAAAIRVATRTAAAFRLPLHVAGKVRGVVSPPRWNAHPAMRWSDVFQESSHNSFVVDGGIGELFVAGVRSFELDIHRGAPTDFFSSVPWPFAPLAIYADHRSHGGGEPGDWQVYHHSGDTTSEYEYLSVGLAEIASLDSADPLTIFLDNKDPLGGVHSSTQLDRLLREQLGDRLFTPTDLMASARGAMTLTEAIEQAGWPTVDQLQGRVMVVLTDDVGGYDPIGGAAFVASKPRFVEGPTGRLQHLADPNVVIYNQAESNLSAEQLELIQSGGSLARTYFGERCEHPWSAESAPNFRAVDHSFPEAGCDERTGPTVPTIITWPTLPFPGL